MLDERIIGAECWKILEIMPTGYTHVLQQHFCDWCKQWFDSHNRSLLHPEVYKRTEAIQEAIKLSRIIRRGEKKLKFPDKQAKENWERFALRMLTAKSHIDVKVAKLYYSAAEVNRLEIKKSLQG